MKLKSSLVLTLPALTLLAASLQAAEVAAPPAAQQTPAAETTAAKTAVPETPAEGARTITAVITPRLFLFDYFDGVGENQTHFLERYDYREGWSDDTRSGVFLDLDLDVTVREGERDLFVMERRGYGEHNHRGTAKYSDDKLGVSGSYSHYRSATGGIDYLYRPSEPALLNYGGTTGGVGGGGGGGLGGGFSNTFNDVSGTSLYGIDRTTYSAGLKIKPSVLGGQATVSVDYEGYQREGNKFAPFLLDSFGGGGGTGQERWRGINLAVDERMNRIGLTLSASPQKSYELAYEVSYEEFANSAPELQVARDITTPYGLGVPLNTSPLASLFYVADTSLITHGIRASKTFSNRVRVSAGYGISWLEQDSFSAYETASNHNKGKINTDNAYLTASGYVSSDVTLEGHIKYYNHDNDSSYGLPDTLSNTGTLIAPRIDSINSMDYGLSANWRAAPLKSRFTAGWRRLDRERDLDWGTGVQSIAQPQSLYREDTVSDEVFLKWSARPAKGWTTELKPAFIRSDKTGLVTEPEEAFLLKAKASYASPKGWLASGFYDYKKRKNNNNSFTDDVVNPSTQIQNLEGTLHSAGLSLNVMPRDNLNVFGSLYWMQDDASNYLFASSSQRWNPAVTFTLLDETNYTIDSWVFSLGGDLQYNDKLKLDGSYTLSKSTGDVASGITQNSLITATGTVDSIIDNLTHSFALGAEYLLNDQATLRVNYLYDRYQDDAYGLLSGGVHMMAVGVSYSM